MRDAGIFRSSAYSEEVRGHSPSLGFIRMTLTKNLSPEEAATWVIRTVQKRRGAILDPMRMNSRNFIGDESPLPGFLEQPGDMGFGFERVRDASIRKRRGRAC